PNHKIESESRTFVYLRNLDFTFVEAGAPTVYLLNATDSDSITTRVRVGDANRQYSLITTDRFLTVSSVPISLTSTQDGILNVKAVGKGGGMAVPTHL